VKQSIKTIMDPVIMTFLFCIMVFVFVFAVALGLVAKVAEFAFNNAILLVVLFLFFLLIM